MSDHQKYSIARGVSKRSFSRRNLDLNCARLMSNERSLHQNEKEEKREKKEFCQYMLMKLC